MTWYKTKRATVVVPDGDGYFACIYHQTKVVRWNTDEVILNSGGYMSATTKTRMNEVSKEYGLGYTVYQKNRVWYVNLPAGQTVEFKDGMVIDRFAADGHGPF